MRTFSLGTLMVLILVSCGLAASTGNLKPEGIIDLTVTENGTIVVADKQGIWKSTSTSDWQNICKDLPGIRAMSSYKKSIYYLRNNELWSLPDAGEPRKLLGQEEQQKLAGSAVRLHGLAVDAYGNIYLLAADEAGLGGILKRNQQGKVTVEVPPGSISELQRTVSLTMAGENSLLVQGEGQAHTTILCLLRKKIIGTIPLGKVATTVYDYVGRLYGADHEKNQVVVQAHPQSKVHPLKHTFRKLAALTYHPARNCLLAIDADEVVSLPVGDPQLPVDETPIPFAVAPAFPNIEWSGWEPVNEKGIPVPLRPIVLTHANDQSNRNFVATQHGVIHIFANTPDVKKTQVFLDIQDRVIYKDNQNEEGFLGLAFHPKYKTNGEFFVYYTKKPGLLSVLSRFKVSKDDPNKADKKSEEVLLTIKQPMWNHNGGTIVFGPDGYLYVGMGDGGGANDMFRNSRKMNTLLSKILRIDVDTKSEGKAYGIPRDNPFVALDGAAPEIFCKGLRNVWRMSFDRETGQGWVADVGQNLYEEINLLVKGGDYGWNPRESYHPFGSNSQPVNDQMIEPIWEYHHNVGKSITGGHVYRGKACPELQGHYLYADYVSAKIWALKYDFDQKRVVANRELTNRGLPIMSFGEDEQGEVYLLTFSARGQGIDRIVRKKD